MFDDVTTSCFHPLPLPFLRLCCPLFVQLQAYQNSEELPDHPVLKSFLESTSHTPDELPDHPVLKSFLESASKGSCEAKGALGDGGKSEAKVGLGDGGRSEAKSGLGDGGRSEAKSGLGDGGRSEAKGDLGDGNEGRGGLSALVHKYLGKPLEKSQQISNWDRRPLKSAQVKYAGMCVCVCSYFSVDL